MDSSLVIGGLTGFTCVALAVLLIAPLVILIYPLYSGVIHRIKGRKKQLAEPKLKKYEQALKRGDIDTAREELIKYADNCPAKNTRCLHEVFCPECPFGGLAVTSCRKGW